MTAPAPLILPHAQLIIWDGQGVTDHNRSELSMTPKRYGPSQRMWDGTARKLHIKDKWTFGVNWEELPDKSSWTVDGKMGGRAMRDFWESHTGAFPMTITNGNGTTETYQVYFTDFSHKIVKRAGKYDMWEVSVELEEV